MTSTEPLEILGAAASVLEATVYQGEHDTCISGICVVHLVKIHVFTYLVQCCDVRYNVCCQTIFALLPFIWRGRIGHMVVGFTTTCVISAFHQ
jgi:hypothetical protein